MLLQLPLAGTLDLQFIRHEELAGKGDFFRQRTKAFHILIDRIYYRGGSGVQRFGQHPHQIDELEQCYQTLIGQL